MAISNRNKVVDAMLYQLNKSVPSGVPSAVRTNFMSQASITKEINVMLLQEKITTRQQTELRELTVVVSCLASGYADGGKDTEQLLDSLVEHVETSLGTGKLVDSAGNQVGELIHEETSWTAKAGEQLIAVSTLTYSVKYAVNFYGSM